MRVDIELSVEEEKRFEAIFEQIEDQEIKESTKKLWLRNRVMSGVLSQEITKFKTDDLAKTVHQFTKFRSGKTGTSL